MARKARLISAFILISILASAPLVSAADAPRTLRVLTHSSFSASKPVIEAFEKAHNARLEFTSGGDAGEMLNKAILTAGNPLADVIYGIDTTFASRALDAGILQPYDSPLLSRIPADLKMDPQNRLLPVDFGYVCPVYDKAWFAARKIATPKTLEDLALPAYKGLLVIENPATSSPGLAFLLSTIAHFGQTGWVEYWSRLRQNDVKVDEGWNDAYYSDFTASGKGKRPIVVSYATDPAADIYYADNPKPSEPRVAAVIQPGGSFRQVEYVGILKGAKNLDLARAWVDYMLSVDFQKDIPFQMWVYPANPDTPLPDLFTSFAPVPTSPALLDPKVIGANREQWIEKWTQTVLG